MVASPMRLPPGFAQGPNDHCPHLRPRPKVLRRRMWALDRLEARPGFCAEHAHRLIFAVEPDEEVARIRPRTINARMLKEEASQWRSWHEEQSQAERDLLR